MLCLRGIPGSSFLGPRSWRSWSWALRVLGVLGALDSLGSRRPLRGFRLPRLIRELWLRVLREFRGRVYAVGEDILLSIRNGEGKGRDQGRASYVKRSEREQGREMAYKKVWVSANMLRNRAPC